MSFDWIEMGVEIEKKGESPPWFTQVHGSTAIELFGVPDRELREADAGFTALSNTEIYVYTADCLPVLIYGQTPSDPIGAVHAGWRGAMKGIVSKTLRQMAVPPSKAQVVLGPSIGACCFEVQPDFLEAFNQAGRKISSYIETRGERLFCNLIEFVLNEELKDVPKGQVSTHLHRCTVCSLPKLPSYRRNKHTDPRLRTWIRKR
jgi:polyphenol oxidase